MRAICISIYLFGSARSLPGLGIDIIVTNCQLSGNLPLSCLNVIKYRYRVSSKCLIKCLMHLIMDINCIHGRIMR